MNTNTVLRFLGWASLTYMWLEANCMFFNAIADAIHHHNEEIRLNTIKKYDYSIFMTLAGFKENFKKTLKKFKEDESEVEGELESEVVETTVTKTFSKS